MKKYNKNFFFKQNTYKSIKEIKIFGKLFITFFNGGFSSRFSMLKINKFFLNKYIVLRFMEKYFYWHIKFQYSYFLGENKNDSFSD